MDVRRTAVPIVLFCATLFPSDPLLAQFAQQGPKLVATGNVGIAEQGHSVAISADGNTAIMGGTRDDGEIGAAWIWIRNGDVWTQQSGKLVGSGAVGSGDQGNSVAIAADGNTAIVGAPNDNNQLGAAWIWVRNGGVWTQQGNKLVGTGAVGNAKQGNSVALSADGNTAIVGGPSDNNRLGAAWLWTRSGGVWTQQGSKLTGTGVVGNTSQQGFSTALSADGNTAIIGGYGDNAANGAAWIWTRSGGVWTQQGPKLVGSGAVSGVGNAWQGWSVAISADGNTAVVGGLTDNSNTGAMWIWTRSGSFWSQQSVKLVPAGNIGASLFAQSVAISGDGNTAIGGGPLFGGNSVGAVWVWTRTSGVWTQQPNALIGSGNSGGSQQGSSVAISADGSTIIVGGPLDKGLLGAAWIFIRTGAGLPTPRRRAVRR